MHFAIMSNQPFWFSVIRQSLITCYHADKVLWIYVQKQGRGSGDRSVTGQCRYIHMDVLRAVFN